MLRLAIDGIFMMCFLLLLVSVSVSVSVSVLVSFSATGQSGVRSACNKVIIITSSLLTHKTKFISFAFMH